ncbi:MAG: aminotransferase class I/II-fold pyridoxal phosphate-dependent enzyme [Oscillospiraceae bacterium]|nr:aminotransferase class I/II-fold pyridoxal phosphate-dependent enzyme [Oscillospiraceae bacterium]
MLYFASDYMESGHEAIFRRFLETNGEHLTGYGSDRYCESAAEKIRAACECPDAEVRFLTGGTQTNQVAVDALLTPWEGVVAAETGHVATHEAGAIEWSGHKVLTLPQHLGKVDAAELRALLKAYESDANREHIVKPGMLYISHPTEYGTLYTKAELEALADVCGEYRIPIYADGARLAYGLAARGTDVTLPVLARCVDAFYIGGTKCGALIGEALVFTKRNLPERFLSRLKQHGALLAKGWAAGLQFDVLFTGGLYEQLGAHAVEMAERLKAGLLAKGRELYIDSPTNQQFIAADDALLAKLEGAVAYGFWEKLPDGRTVIRFATSWATKAEDVDALLAFL